jgi:hypothetical protein
MLHAENASLFFLSYSFFGVSYFAVFCGCSWQIDKAKRHVLVHFIGYNKRYDEWLPYNSERLREIQPAEPSAVESDGNHWARYDAP